MEKTLIIGHKGNLGQALSRFYEGSDLVCWDRDEIDITDENQVMAKVASLKPRLIYNCTAYNAVDLAETNPADADALNGYAVGFLARAAEECGASIVHFSTNYVFSGKNPEGYDEDAQPEPLSAYGRSKRLGEIELMKASSKFYLVRTAWLYGKPTGNGKKSFVQTMLDLALQGKQINVVNDEFGQPTLTDDLSQALVALTEEQNPYGIYHITNEGMASWYDWAMETFRIKGLKPNVQAIRSQELSRPAMRPKYGLLNNTKFIKLRPWTEALEEFIKTA
jgi:dTDP-4-dehydrorhamnose reductase